MSGYVGDLSPSQEKSLQELKGMLTTETATADEVSLEWQLVIIRGGAIGGVFKLVHDVSLNEIYKRTRTWSYDVSL